MAMYRFPKRLPPKDYIKYCGGAHQALTNAMCVIGQTDPSFEIPPWWIEVKSLSEKALGGEKMDKKFLYDLRLQNLKDRMKAAQDNAEKVGSVEVASLILAAQNTLEAASAAS